MRISFRDVNKSVVDAVRPHLEPIGVQVTHGSILDLECDAVVSPGNSFGFMDGNLDYVYSMHFGWQVQTQLQQMIEHLPFGELLVGQALVVPTGKPRIHHVIAAPTMRVPMRIVDPANVMLAARAAFHEAKRYGFEHIAFPGMGTGCGKVSGHQCGSALRAAMTTETRSKPATWREAQSRHFLLMG